MPDLQPLLAKVLRAVLDLHKPFQRNLWIGNPWQCSHCVEEDGTGTTEPLLYPCPTVQAITDAIGDEDAA